MERKLFVRIGETGLFRVYTPARATKEGVGLTRRPFGRSSTKGRSAMKPIFTLFTFSALSFGEVVMPGTSFLAHIADGGGITMNITLLNLNDTPNPSHLLFSYTPPPFS